MAGIDHAAVIADLKAARSVALRDAMETYRVEGTREYAPDAPARAADHPEVRAINEQIAEARSAHAAAQKEGG
jgi:hypothetical protein